MNAKFQKNEKDFEFLIKKRLEHKNEYFPSSEAKEKKDYISKLFKKDENDDISHFSVVQLVQAQNVVKKTLKLSRFFMKILKKYSENYPSLPPTSCQRSYTVTKSSRREQEP